MMTNLFSVFDPSFVILSVTWIVLPLAVTLYSVKMWKISSTFNKMSMKVNFMFKKEVEFSLSQKESGTENLIMGVFFSVTAFNVIALYPQVFSSTSHLAVTLPLALSFWLSLVMFGWVKNTSRMLSHLVPQGTPGALMMFMVLIELTSNMIRPITLCVRLTANLIAGHLLMTLLGNFMMSQQLLLGTALMFMPMILSILETAVACIQAYVFMTLVTLYTTEVK